MEVVLALVFPARLRHGAARACAPRACDLRDPAFQSLAEREWSLIDSTIAAAVEGESALPGEESVPAVQEVGSPFVEARQSERDRITWKIQIAYHGPAFSGFSWQKSAPKPTVESCLQDAIRPLLDGRSELRLSCAGRTDAGVSALGQLVSFYSSPGLRERQLADAISSASPQPGALRLVQARRVERGFHATYSTSWRRYAYFLPPAAGQSAADVAEEAEQIDALLRPLAGVARDYSALGRSMPLGKNTTMLLRYASARLVELAGTHDGVPAVATRIDLVGDRFLRQQVRTLVGTAIALVGGTLEAEGTAADDERRLLALCVSGDPELTAHPAPAVGLVLAGAGSADELDPSWLCDGESFASNEPAELTDLGLEHGYALESGAAATRQRKLTPEERASAFVAALSLCDQQQACGAPLDVLLSRYVRANGLGQAERAAISAHLDAVARCQGRLDSRLKAAGVSIEPRSRLLASIRLCSEESVTMIGGITALTDAETGWLNELEPPLENGATMEMASRLECPSWAWSSMRASFSEGDLEDEMRALQHAAPLDLRVNTLRTSRDAALSSIRAAGFDAQPTRYSPVGIRLAERSIPLGSLPGLLEGLVDPQDEGSQLVALLLDAQPGDRVADYCAGSGGKTMALAAQMRNKGRLLAMDIDEARLGRSAPRLAKAGVDVVERHVIDPGSDKWLKRRKRSFDRVLVDAPCSGVGAWRRNPDARWLRRTRPLDELLPVQAEVLGRAARLVVPGGVLVYATCSLLREENEEQVEAFLASADGEEFELTPPASFHVPLDGPYLKLTPARHGCDGFFGAVLTRREGGWSRARRKPPTAKQ